MDDDVRGPEVVDHVAPHVDLPGRPVGGAVQDHSGLRPHQLVSPPNTDLLKKGQSQILSGVYVLAVWFTMSSYYTYGYILFSSVEYFRIQYLCFERFSVCGFFKGVFFVFFRCPFLSENFI